MELLREPPPDLVSRAASRLSDISTEKVNEIHRRDWCGKSHLTGLDELRYQDPMRAFVEAQAILEAYLARELDVDSTYDVIFVLGVLGSAARMLSNLDAAHHAVGVALDFASLTYSLRGSFPLALAQRAVYVLASEGDCGLALDLARWIYRRYDRIQDKNGKGKSLVDCGHILLRNKEYSDALDSYFHALQLLPESSVRNRYAAKSGIVEASYRLGDLEQARRYIVEVRRSVLAKDQHALAMINLQEAKILRDLGDQAGSLRCFKTAIDLLSNTGQLIELVLASVNAVELLLEMGKPSRACALAERMIVLSFGLSRHRVIWRAVEDLIQAARKGELSLALVATARRMIENGRPIKRAPVSANG